MTRLIYILQGSFCFCKPHVFNMKQCAALSRHNHSTSQALITCQPGIFSPN